MLRDAVLRTPQAAQIIGVRDIPGLAGEALVHTLSARHSRNTAFWNRRDSTDLP